MFLKNYALIKAAVAKMDISGSAETINWKNGVLTKNGSGITTTDNSTITYFSPLFNEKGYQSSSVTWYNILCVNTWSFAFSANSDAINFTDYNLSSVSVSNYSVTKNIGVDESNNCLKYTITLSGVWGATTTVNKIFATVPISSYTEMPSDQYHPAQIHKKTVLILEHMLDTPISATSGEAFTITFEVNENYN